MKDIYRNLGQRAYFEEAKKRMTSREATDQVLKETLSIKEAESEILICDCNSSEHQIIIHKDSDENIVYCHIRLVKRSFWKRLILGIKYIFGYKCKFGHWDEFVFKPEHSQQIQNLLEHLNKKL